MKSPQILETTLRDGSYPINFGFTAKDTRILCAGLEKSGFELIEIGHGVGLGASNAGFGKAAESDESYLKAAASVLKHAKFGMFYIPGIGQLKNIEMAAKHGMGFIRVGTNANAVEQAEKPIGLAKHLGMQVYSNLMKSYALPPKELVKQAQKAEHYGADVVVLVDSAGGMTPRSVREYMQELRKGLKLELGYHGHNNLQLAVANSLAALEAGATIIDTSLLGIGRSAGNTPTELFLLVLKKLGMQTSIDIDMVLNLGYKFVAPYLANTRRYKPVTAIAGYADFHSSFLKKVYVAAKKYNLSLRDIVLEVSKVEKVNVTDAIVEQISRQLSKNQKRAVSFELKLMPEPGVKFSIEEDLNRILSTMNNIGSKLGKQKLFTITMTKEPHDPTIILPFTIESQEFIIGSAEVFKPEQLIHIIKSIDDQVDYLLVDSNVRLPPAKSKLKHFSMTTVIASAGSTLISQLAHPGMRVLVLGNNKLSKSLAWLLANKRFKVLYAGREPLGNKLVEQVTLPCKAEFIVGCSRHNAIKGIELNSSVKALVDLGIGSFNRATIKHAIDMEIPVYRADTRDALIGEATKIIETDKRMSTQIGKTQFEGIPVVGAGMMGKQGDIIVDSITRPTKVLGVADGTGHVIYGESKWDKRKEKVREFIYKAMLSQLETSESDETIFKR